MSVLLDTSFAILITVNKTKEVIFMTTARITNDRNNFKVIKGRGNKKVNKRLDRLCAIALLLIGVVAFLVEKDLIVLTTMLFISTPLIFSKKQYVHIL